MTRPRLISAIELAQRDPMRFPRDDDCRRARNSPLAEGSTASSHHR